MKNHEGFNADLFKDLFELEPKHFWYRNRNRLITWALRRYFPTAKSFFEVGCGSGYVLSGIEEECPWLKTGGCDLYGEALSCAEKRLKTTRLFQLDARKISFHEEFDILGAFDVLEHIVEDTVVISAMHQAVRPGGGIIITVPQHRFLWSLFDEQSHHVRRYGKNELRVKIENAGFKIKSTTSFVSLLLPLVILSRLQLGKSTQQYDHIANIKFPPWQNNVLEKVLECERFLITSGLSFPVGSSLLLIAQKD